MGKSRNKNTRTTQYNMVERRLACIFPEGGIEIMKNEELPAVLLRAIDLVTQNMKQVPGLNFHQKKALIQQVAQNLLDNGTFYRLNYGDKDRMHLRPEFRNARTAQAEKFAERAQRRHVDRSLRKLPSGSFELVHS